MPSPTKTRYPFEQAMAVARELEGLLAPFCRKIEIAGSLRRKKPDVGDVEILFIPAFETRRLDLFREGPVDLAAEWLDRQLGGILEKRIGEKGSTVWGPKNKLAVYRPAAMPVDFFSASEDTWACSLVCRTGPAEMNMRIAEAARRKGYKWHPIGRGFEQLGGGPEVAIESEAELFEFLGLPCLPPERRR